MCASRGRAGERGGPHVRRLPAPVAAGASVGGGQGLRQHREARRVARRQHAQRESGPGEARADASLRGLRAVDRRPAHPPASWLGAGNHRQRAGVRKSLPPGRGPQRAAHHDHPGEVLDTGASPPGALSTTRAGQLQAWGRRAPWSPSATGSHQGAVVAHPLAQTDAGAQAQRVDARHRRADALLLLRAGRERGVGAAAPRAQPARAVCGAAGPDRHGRAQHGHHGEARGREGGRGGGLCAACAWGEATSAAGAQGMRSEVVKRCVVVVERAGFFEEAGWGAVGAWPVRLGRQE